MTIKDYSITAEFRSKAPHTTAWLEIGYHTDRPPTALFEQLAAVGWTDDGMRGIPPMANGRTEACLSKPGTGLFGAWTPEEKRVAMDEARRILRRHRVYAGSVRRMTLAELL